jgi:hypothetical protein
LIILITFISGNQNEVSAACKILSGTRAKSMRNASKFGAAARKEQQKTTDPRPPAPALANPVCRRACSPARSVGDRTPTPRTASSSASTSAWAMPAILTWPRHRPRRRRSASVELRRHHRRRRRRRRRRRTSRRRAAAHKVGRSGRGGGGCGGGGEVGGGGARRGADQPETFEYAHVQAAAELEAEEGRGAGLDVCVCVRARACFCFRQRIGRGAALACSCMHVY